MLKKFKKEKKTQEDILSGWTWPTKQNNEVNTDESSVGHRVIRSTWSSDWNGSRVGFWSTEGRGSNPLPRIHSHLYTTTSSHTTHNASTQSGVNTKHNKNKNLSSSLLSWMYVGMTKHLEPWPSLTQRFSKTGYKALFVESKKQTAEARKRKWQSDNWNIQVYSRRVCKYPQKARLKSRLLQVTQMFFPP